jgi:pimeloyl-ACP methyl ester carboxylesterase
MGRWSGAAIENGTPKLFELTFQTRSDGKLHTTLTLPYNGYDQFPFAFTYTQEGELDGTLKAGLFGDEMRLTLNLAEGHLRGYVVTKGSVTAHVHLQKVPDFSLPFIVSKEVSFPAGKATLAGTLMRPRDVKNPPIAILIPGRGHADRLDILFWGKLLARNGVAALAWDARGYGKSTGELKTESSETLTEDVRSAMRWVKSRRDLGPMGLLSYSAGGWIAPVVAAGRKDIKFVVSLAGPAVSLANQQAATTVAFMRVSETKFTQTEFQQAFLYQQQTVLLAKRGADWAEFETINAAARASRWKSEALIPASLADPDLQYFRSHPFGTPPWSRVTAPVLAIFGETDPLVSPLYNVPILKQALVKNLDATIVVAPGADHTLARPSGYVGAGDDRYFRPWTRSPWVFESIIRWFQERFPLKNELSRGL